MSLGARDISSSLLNMMYKSSVARKVIMLVLICSFCGDIMELYHAWGSCSVLGQAMHAWKDVGLSVGESRFRGTGCNAS